MPDVEVAESSAANEIPAGTPDAHETWTDDQRAEWLRTGETPKPAAETPPPAESAPAPATEGEKPKVETAPAPEPEAKQEPKPKGAEARKAELAAEIQDLLRQRRELRQEVDAGRSGAAKPATPAEQPSDDPEPLTTAYATGADGSMTVEDLQKFQRAHSQWAIRQDRKAEAQRNAERSHEERLERARAAHDDWDEVIDGVGNTLRFDRTPAGPAMKQAILESDDQMEILYHLSKNPAEFRRIAALPPRKAFKAIVDLEESLTAPPAKKDEAPPTPAPRKQTQAPTPITEL
jgi:hypothetical protein